MKSLVLPVYLAAFFATIGAPADTVQRPAAHPGDLITCVAKEAEYVVHVHYTLTGVIENREKIEYLRTQKPPRLRTKNSDGSEIWDVDAGYLHTEVTNADGRDKSGRGIGYTSSITIDGKARGFVLRVSIHWDNGEDSGEFQKSWAFDQMSDTKLSEGRFHADIRVEKLTGVGK